MTAPSFQVFIDGAREPGADARARMAQAVGAKYGIPADRLESRLAAGSMRVKAGLDRAAADRLAADLAALGAVCSVVDAPAPASAPASALPPAPASRPAQPASALPPAPARPAAPSAALPPAGPSANPAQPYASGLAAAFAPGGGSQDLGALGSGSLSLATLDGADDAAPAVAGALPASFGPPAAADAAADAPPLDLFAPPEATEAQELAVDVADVRPRASAPRIEATFGAAPAAAAAAEPVASPPRSELARWVGDRRARLAAGVLLAILLGFAPASLVAGVRERAADADVDRKVQQRFEGARHDLAAWKALDADLARLEALKLERRESIALVSMLIWAAVGGALAFAWFRKVDWDGLAARLEARAAAR